MGITYYPPGKAPKAKAAPVAGDVGSSSGVLASFTTRDGIALGVGVGALASGTGIMKALALGIAARFGMNALGWPQPNPALSFIRMDQLSKAGAVVRHLAENATEEA